MDMNQADHNLSQSELLDRYKSYLTGLSTEEAERRLARYGENKLT